MKEKCDNRNQTRIGKHIDKHLPNGLLIFLTLQMIQKRDHWCCMVNIKKII